MIENIEQFFKKLEQLIGVKQRIEDSFFSNLASSEQRLLVAISLAVLFHIIVLSINFVIEPIKHQSFEPLDIILNPIQKDDQEPLTADYLAQSSQQGGGSLGNNIRPTNVISATPKAEVEKEKKKVGKSKQEELKKHKTILQAKTQSTLVIRQLKDKHQSVQKQEQKNQIVKQRYLSQLKQQIIDLEADLNDEANAYAKKSKKKFVNASTSKSHDATYIKQWTKKIETVGNQFYPKKVKRLGLSGRLVLSVTLNASGHVLDIDVLSSSNHKTLDQAAIDIVKRSSPFPHIPKRVLLDNTSLVITRTWLFSDSKSIVKIP